MSVGIVSIPASVHRSDVYGISSENPEAVSFSQQAGQWSDVGRQRAISMLERHQEELTRDESVIRGGGAALTANVEKDENSIRSIEKRSPRHDSNFSHFCDRQLRVKSDFSGPMPRPLQGMMLYALIGGHKGRPDKTVTDFHKSEMTAESLEDAAIELIRDWQRKYDGSQPRWNISLSRDVVMDLLKTKETGFKAPGEIKVWGRSLRILKSIYTDDSLKNEEHIDPGIFWHDEKYGLSQRNATEALGYLDKAGLIKIVPPKVDGAGLAGSVVDKIPGLEEGAVKHFYLWFSSSDCEGAYNLSKPDWFDPIVLDKREDLPNTWF